MDTLAQAITLPDNWWWIILTAFGVWLSTKFWPFFETLWSADAKARRDRILNAEKDDEQRYLRAIESAAQAALQTAAALDKIGTALDMFGRDTIARTMELSEMRREMRDANNAVMLALGAPRRRSSDRVDRVRDDEPNGA